MRVNNPDSYRLLGFEVNRGNKKKYNAVLQNKKTKEKLRISFGAKGYSHYYDKIGHYESLNHLDKERRKRYKQRHEGTRHYKYSSSYFADRYLW
jgi:hypothetical protein